MTQNSLFVPRYKQNVKVFFLGRMRKFLILDLVLRKVTTRLQKVNYIYYYYYYYFFFFVETLFLVLSSHCEIWNNGDNSYSFK